VDHAAGKLRGTKGYAPFWLQPSAQRVYQPAAPAKREYAPIKLPSSKRSEATISRRHVARSAAASGARERHTVDFREPCRPTGPRRLTGGRRARHSRPVREARIDAPGSEPCWKSRACSRRRAATDQPRLFGRQGLDDQGDELHRHRDDGFRPRPARFGCGGEREDLHLRLPPLRRGAT